MARQFQPYEPELHKLSSPNSETPSSPFPRGETPLSFKTNVNRSKTKRWVEAKKYSYDGNDWGDDEYDEYDDDDGPPPPVPAVPSSNQSTGDIPGMFTRGMARPPLPSMDRSRSLDHVATLDAAAADSRSRSVDRTATDPNNRTVPIVRPAEIYKRIRAESATRPQPPADYFALNPSGAGPPVPESASQDIPSASRAPEAAGAPDDHPLHQAQGSSKPSDVEGTPKGSYSSETRGSDPPGIKLPDVKRLSGFSPDLSFGPALQTQTQDEAEPGHQLQHNPSLGFRSVVHQAFDVPDTPSSTVDSVGRSNSDSTSVISPIIAQRNPSETKTPTIVEEPESITTPSDARGSMVFKPGHRRDLSLPSPNNSPSRTPVVTSVQGAPLSAAGEMTSDSPLNLYSTSPKAAVQLPEAGRDLPAPLSVGTSHMTSEPIITADDGVPVVIPSLSTDNSPQDTESDRLRKEIMRSLSRENTPSQELENPVESQSEARQDSLIPSEYERYWSEEPLSSPQGATPEYSTPPIIPDAPPPALDSAAAPARPKLGRRFSWESSSSGGPTPEADVPATEAGVLATETGVPATETGVQSPAAPMPGQFPVPSENEAQPEETIPNYEQVVEESAESEEPPPEKPKLSIVPPIPDNRSIISDGQLPEVYNAEAIPDSHADEGPVAGSDRRASRIMFTTPTTTEPILLGFREILGMKTSEDRVRAFNENRAKFGTIDTGLNQWLSMTVQAHPEHKDVVEKSMKQTPGGVVKAPVSRGKFPKKLASLGNFASSHPDGSPSGSGHVRRPSAPLGAMMNKQQVEQRGKELLHSAGVLGGRAGEAAKGFFARGRSKLKGSGNNDKVDS
ncbi:hypothetical protein BO70DRAFT_357950 [Aspergillus heteromorphus CBS 117.55]|uniref:Uncharacterized protein n=1 Tax=Aspergillus heteromorphus CBS 117.55 TaxID=1448321 RepID=A0A317X5B6_9EURO|nr:uncharacterized protein BO70DRAFT_357950 [Aspergillus heteromorphus CBS 117.55]PWY92812.1 hypothetical protein BO70DRAFT_357950 [Aspergillus heteromorphus CBS 117.55]